MCNPVIPGGKSPDGIHLIFHKRNQRGNDHSRSFHYQSRELVAKRFAPSGRHEDKRVFAAHKVLYHPFLVSFEGVESEEIL